MSEKLSKQERAELTSSVGSLVDVDVNGRARVPKGSVGSDYIDDNGKRHFTKGGSFMSDYELQQIAAHTEQIDEGYAARESENMIENAVGVLTDPSDIRDSLFMQGYIDDEEFADWSDAEIMKYVDDARAEVATYGGASSEVNDTAEESTAEDAVVEEASVAHTPKHRAEFSDEDTPLFEELKAEQVVADEAVRENESLEEYEARQPREAGRHRRDVSADELEAMLNPASAEQSQERSVSADDLEAMLNSNVGEGRLVGEFTAAAAAEQDTPTVARSWRRRLRDMATPAGLAAELGRMSGSARERLGKRKKGKLALGLLAVAAAGVGVAVYAANRHNGGGSGGNGGNWLNDIMNNIGDAADKAKDAATDKPTGGGGHNGSVEWADFLPKARNVHRGEGWYNTFKEMGIPKEHWADVLNDAGPKLGKIGEAYYDNNAGEWRISRPGQLSESALRVIAAASKRDGVDLAA